MDKLYKWLFIINLLVGLALFLIGIYIYFIESVNVTEEELKHTLEINYKKLNGLSTIIVAVIVLIFSRKTYEMYSADAKYAMSSKRRGKD